VKTVGVLLGLSAGAVLMVVVIAVTVLFPSVGPSASTTAESCSVTTETGKLSAAQVASFAYAAGFRGQDLQIATAITEPESGADTTAVQQDEPPQLTGYGLWQLTPGTTADLDPMTNAKGAYAKYVAAGDQFTPWTTFTGGEYLSWMGWAAAGAATMSAAGLSCQSNQQQSSAQTDVLNGQSGSVVVEATPAGLPSTFDSYPAGQCTFWAAYNHAGTPPFLGNAADWWTNGPAKGMQTSPTPIVGWVVVYGAGGGYSSDGHVAIVIQVDSATTFDVSEMNYVGTGIVDERTSTTADVLGFLS
jgi:surface antigen